MEDFSCSPGQLQEAARRLRALVPQTDGDADGSTLGRRDLMDRATDSAHQAVDATAAALERTAQQYLTLESEAEQLIRTTLGTLG